MLRRSILILSPFFKPNIGGVETHLDDLCKYLKKQNCYRIYVLTYQPITTNTNAPFLEKDGSVVILRIPWIGFNLFHKLEPYPILEFSYLTPWLFLWTTIFLILKYGEIDTIHSQGFNASFIISILINIFRKKFIAGIHAIYGINKNSLMAKMVRLTLNRTDKILTLSEASRRELIKIGLSENKIDTYTYWVDQDIFKPFNKIEAKKSIGWEGKFVVLFVGRFIEIKGIDILLELAKSVDKNIYFAFIGDGPLSFKIKNRSRLFYNIIFIGKIDNFGLPLYYNATDILCVPSQYEEGFGRVIIEALSCGTPVIASNRGGIPEAVNDKVCILAEPTVENLKHVIESLYTSPKRLYKMRGYCREYAMARFSEKNAERIVNSYD